MPKAKFLLILLACIFGCQATDRPQSDLLDGLEGTPAISGRAEYLPSPFVTAGDRLYVVGHQDGSFPDLGWHLPGEMGGVWAHPIKLLDGYRAAVRIGEQQYSLNRADKFINYPFAGRHVYEAPAPGLRTERFQFVPDGLEALYIEYLLENTTDQVITLDFRFTPAIDLRPVWLGERTGMINAEDVLLNNGPGRIAARDRDNEWFVTVGTKQEFLPVVDSTSLVLSVEIPARGRMVLPFVVAGSMQSLEAATQQMETVLGDLPELIRAKKTHFSKIDSLAQLHLPDSTLEVAFQWVKYNTEWLVQEVPSIGRGLTAGIPDYPWWFGADSEYALLGALATGRFDLVASTIELLHRVSDTLNANGRILHEVSTNGAVFNPGNINETPQFASLIWAAYEWTGDRTYLDRYYPTVQRGLEWLLTEMDSDGNLVADGFGMMEIHGLDSEMIDVAAYTQRALADATRMAEALDRPEEARQYRAQAEQLAQTINTQFWVPAFASYADFIGTTQQAERLIEQAIVRADTLGKPWAVAELRGTLDEIASYPPDEKRGFVVHHNWVVNTPMETGVADSAKAIAALNTGSRFVNPFGIFVTGIDRDASAGEDDSSFAEDQEIFSYVGAVMTLPTGVQAIAENNYGRPNQALDYLQRMTRSFSYALPGSIYEVSPDFGMITQAWTLYSYAVPIVQQFFGILPRAYERTVLLRPQMPDAWPEAQLERIRVGDNEINVKYQKSEEGLELEVTQTQANWTIIFEFPKDQYSNWTLNGNSVRPETNQLTATGNTLHLQLTP